LLIYCMLNFSYIKRYMHYFLHAVSKYHIHSPFVFELLSKVFDDKYQYPDYAKIGSIRNEMMESTRLIEVNDFGAKSQNKPYTTSYQTLRQITRNTSIRPKFGELIYRLVKNTEPEILLEMGTSLGISSLYLALAAPNSRLYCMEGCSNKAGIALENFEKLKIQNISLNVGHFDHILPEVLQSLPAVDIVFIDGNHRYEPTVRYFETILPKTRSNTILIFDDIHWSEDMEKAWLAICNHPAVTLTLDVFFMGFVFFKQGITRQNILIRF